MSETDLKTVINKDRTLIAEAKIREFANSTYTLISLLSVPSYSITAASELRIFQANSNN